MNTAIRVEKLIKNYGQNRVIKEVSLEVKKGEVFAILGVNGAGKTTILECVEGLRRYDSGNIEIHGSFGVQLQTSTLPANIKALEAFTLFSKWNKTNVDLSIFQSLGLGDIKNMQYCQMSTGQKRRLHLALSLIGSPDIIFLDEPTAGLDVEGRVALHEQILRLKGRGKTIILTSHDMAEVESLCDRIAILKEGNITFLGSTTELTNQMSSSVKLLIKTGRPFNNRDFANSSYEGTENNYYCFNTTSISELLIEILTSLKASSNPVLDIRVIHQSLEQSFLDIAREGK